MAQSLLVEQLREIAEKRRLCQFNLESCLAILLDHLSLFSKSATSNKEALLRAATASDRVGLLAIVNRVNADDAVVFELCRRVRVLLQR
jgi:hypothetical protein